MTVFLLGRELRLLQNLTTDTKLLREAAERALTLEATSLQAKDFRDDPLSHSSLLEEMAGAEARATPRAERQARKVAAETPRGFWRCGHFNCSDLKESNMLSPWTSGRS